MTEKRSIDPGDLIAGKYRVEHVLGEGGMGLILAARHEALAVDVAVKVLRHEALGHGDVVGRFLREARAAVSLKSQHVARVFDVGTLEDGRPYMVMERLVGKDLAQLVEQGPLPIEDAVDYVLQASEAIAEAHAAGIVHRDLKPANLFLTQSADGRPLVKVLDFGISKVDAPVDMQLTKTAEIIGSPSYMSPEQLRSARSVDLRTDIWALGVILYELLTGRLPFEAETITSLVLVVVGEKPPALQALRSEIPAGLQAIVARCLEKRPDDRFATVLDLVVALEPYARRVESTATERVRAIAAASGRLPSSPSLSIGSSSSRIKVHGSTESAWAETQSSLAPEAAPPVRSSRKALPIAMIVALVICVIAFAVLRTRRSEPSASVTTAREIDLPSGRKDLPPIAVAAPPSSAIEPPPAESPALAMSALPSVRKPRPVTTAAAPLVSSRPSAPIAPHVPPAPPANDDLSQIGRR